MVYVWAWMGASRSIPRRQLRRGRMGSHRTSGGRFGLALAVLVAAARAHAEPGDQSLAAQALFDERVSPLDRGESAAACSKLSQSHALDPAGGTAPDIGYCEERQGNIASAIMAYDDARRRARVDGRADRERLAEQKLDELAGRANRLRVRLAPGEARRSDVTAAIDERPLGSTMLGSAVIVDAGKRTVTVRAPGKKPFFRCGTVFGLAAFAAHEESDHGCPGGACTQARGDAADRARTYAWVSTGTIALGALLAGAGLYAFLERP